MKVNAFSHPIAASSSFEENIFDFDKDFDLMLKKRKGNVFDFSVDRGFT